MSHMKSILGKLFRQVIWESVFTLAEITFGKYFPKEKSTFRNKKVLSETTFRNEKVFPKQLSETKKLLGK